MDITISGEVLTLLPQKAIYWKRKNALLLADTHFGKTGHFRKAGIAVPEGLANKDILTLQALITRYKPETIYFLGDLFHSHVNNEWQLVNELINSLESTKAILIKGNHDILKNSHYLQNSMQVVDEPYTVSPFVLTHHPQNENHLNINIAGHLHPGITMRGKGKSSLSTPCFHVKQNQIILPAFTSFAGKGKVDLKENDKIYLISDTKVIPANITKRTKKSR